MTPALPSAESLTVEFKSDRKRLPDSDLVEAIVCLANAEGGTLINLMETGADWLTGGEFGPEGGLAVTIVLVIGIAVILFWKSKESVQEVPVQ